MILIQDDVAVAQTKSVNWLRRMAWSFIVTPLAMFLPLTIIPFLDPRVLVEGWDLYLLLYGLPLALGLGLLLVDRELRRRPH